MDMKLYKLLCGYANSGCGSECGIRGYILILYYVQQGNVITIL